MEARVPSKKDKWGYTFGFLSFVEVEDPVEFQKELEAIKVDGRKTWMTISKFGKESAVLNLPPPPKPKGAEIPSEKQGNMPPCRNAWTSGTHLTYREVAKQNGDTSKVCHDIVIQAGGGRPNVHPLKEVSLLGKTKNLAVLDNLNLYLKAKDGWPECEVRYLGGLYVVLSFKNTEEANNFLKLVWTCIFSSLVFWDGSPPAFERVAWLTITGIPPHLFDCDTFNQIGAWCGRVVHASNASSTEGNLSFDRIAVVTSQGERLNKTLRISFNNSKFQVWIKEDEENWVPRFLSPDRKPLWRGGYAGISLFGSNENDLFQVDTGHSAARKSKKKPQVFDSDFEASMAERSAEKDPLELNDAHVEMSNDCLDPMVEYLGRQFDGMGPMSHKSFSNKSHSEVKNIEQVWFDIFGPESTVKEHGLMDGPFYQTNGVCSDGPFQDKSNGPACPVGSLQPEGLEKNLGSGRVDSDPFNLGPLIDEVMNNHKAPIKTNRRGFVEYEGNQRRSRAHKHKGNLENIGYISRFKLSRYFLKHHIRSLKKRGPTRTSISSNDGSAYLPSAFQDFDPTGTSLSQSANNIDNHRGSVVCQDLQVEKARQDEEEKHPTREPSLLNGSVDHLNSEHPNMFNQAEVEETIRINSLVQIDLNGFQRQVGELIIEEGSDKVHQ
ncbi:hypothetical protein QVD17_16033 [Tagetes erecta]|uniref:DUF4283 domain-containing protein n=1 Tax=Tagetes erecta TaxID=13708 RepID=A0AAD8NT59_TARER|nr:hypothetical protein QVD17_16033 [Tagetes erecta]